MAELPTAVTVVLVVGRQRERSARALASVLGQEGIDRSEVVLVDAGPPGVEALPGADHASVRVVERPGRGPFGAVRADAVRLARAPVVAFLEEHAEARDGWIVGIEAAFADPAVAGASGEVHTLNPGVGISDVIAVMNYVRWLPPLREGWDADVIVGHNAAYRTDDLLAFGAELDELLSSEVVLQRALRARGRRLVIDPRIAIGHTNEVTTRSISRGYYLWNVSFGATWADAERWSRLRRALQVVGAPWWVVRRVADILGGATPAHRRVLLRHLGSVVASQCAGAAGIAVGATRGAGDAGTRFTDYELDIDRPTSSTSSA